MSDSDKQNTSGSVSDSLNPTVEESLSMENVDAATGSLSGSLNPKSTGGEVKMDGVRVVDGSQGSGVKVSGSLNPQGKTVTMKNVSIGIPKSNPTEEKIE